MKRTSAYLGLGGAFLAAALLAACGGSGGGTSIPSAQNSGASQSGSQTSGSKLKLTIVIPRNMKHRSQKTRTASKRPMYVSTGAEGLQLAITPTGGATTTLYADITPTSPLCQPGTPNDTPDGTEVTCTIPLPVLGATESVTGTVTNQTPNSVNSSGMGTGFPADSLVLGVGTTTVTTTGGVNTIALGIGPVAASIYDCTGYLPAPPDPSHFSDDYDIRNVTASAETARIVVTAGATTSGYISQEFEDPNGDWYDAIPTPGPGFTPVPPDLVDVNGSPAPITYTASSSNITLGLSPAVTSTTTPFTYAAPSSFSSSGSIATDADYLNDCAFYTLVKVNALATPAPGASPPTITFANNLSATAAAPFSGGPYPFTLTYTVVALSASSYTIDTSTGSSPTVNGWDYGATNISNPIGAESAYGLHDGDCYDTSAPSQVDATVSDTGSFNTTTWLQQFTIDPTTPGTCTFVLYDANTGVVTQPITVDIAPV